MRFACRAPKATATHSEYVILIVFPLQQWLHVRAPTLRYSTLPGSLKLYRLMSTRYRSSDKKHYFRELSHAFPLYFASIWAQKSESRTVTFPLTVHVSCHMWTVGRSKSLCLWASAKFRKSTVPSVCPRDTIRFHTERIFLKCDNFSIFRKIFEKIQVSLNSDKNDGSLTRRPVVISGHISLSSS